MSDNLCAQLRALIAKRTPARKIFSQRGNKLEALITANQEDPHAIVDEIHDLFGIVDTQYQTIKALDQQIADLIVDETLHAKDDEIDAEFEKVSEYDMRFIALTRIRNQHMRRLAPPVQHASSVASLDNLEQHAPQAFATGPGTPAAPTPIRARLPKLELPKFHGDPLEWSHFWGLFKVSVHDAHISGVEKLAYLQSLLVGEAAACVRGIAVSEVGYDQAVARLTKRYSREDEALSRLWKKFSELPPLKSQHSQHLRSFTDNVHALLCNLENAGIAQNRYNQAWFPPLVEKVGPQLHMKWLEEEEEENVVNLLGFLERQATLRERAFGHCSKASNSIESPPPNTKFKSSKDRSFGQSLSKPRLNSTLLHSTSEPTNKPALKVEGSVKCVFCSGPHRIHKCDTFLKEEPQKRIEAVKRLRLCFNCLGTGHSVKDCPSKHSCRECNAKHHSVLHLKKKSASNLSTSEQPTEPDTPNQADQSTTSISCTQKSDPKVVLGTILVSVDTPKGPQQIRILLDSGSQDTFITSAAAKRLHCRTISSMNLIVQGIGGIEKQLDTYKVEVVTPKLTLNAIVLENVCSDLPTFNASIARNFADLQLCEVYDGEIHAIDVLLGMDYFLQVFGGGYLAPIEGVGAIRTIFGWTLVGKIPDEIRSAENNRVSAITHQTMSNRATSFVMDEVAVDQQLCRFFEVEGAGVKEPNSLSLTTPLTSPVVDQFSKSIVQADDGRYTVKIPWNKDVSALSSIEQQTRKRYYSLRKRLTTLGSLADEYHAIFRDYMDKGFIRELLPTERPIHFLPHHAVVRSDKSSTKVRVVFDGSARDIHGLSLNDFMCSGEAFNSDILAIIIRFRQHSVALTADIRQAFLQIGLDENDQRYTCFLWPSTKHESLPSVESSPPMLHCFQRVPFGLKSSPFLLQATLRHHLLSQPDHSSSTIELLAQSFYVDDLVISVQDEATARNVADRADRLMASMACSFKHWTSNCTSLHTAPSIEPVHVLGIQWDPNKDTIECIPPKLPTVAMTRRGLMRFLASIWDPLGIFAPFVFRGKLLMQRAWSQTSAWDEDLPEQLSSEVMEWISQSLESFPRIAIRRFSFPIASLEVFCDASEAGCGVVVYFVSVQGERSFSMAKTKVVSPKIVTLPRLELEAALMGANLISYHLTELQQTDLVYRCYSDSQVVLGWIAGDPYRFKPFVKNRVLKIQSKTAIQSWHHVPGTQNPADLASRGCSIDQLVNNHLWLHGPPPFADTTPAEADLPVEEFRKSKVHTVSLVQAEANTVQLLLDFTRYSHSWKAIRVAQRVLEACAIFKSKAQLCELIHPSLKSARNLCLRQSQRVHFVTQISSLLAGELLLDKDPLAKYHPWIDDNGILRAKTRTSLSNLSFDENNPIILHDKCPFVRLLIQEAHERLLHASTTPTWNLLRDEFCILRARQTIRSVLSQCVPCRYKFASLIDTPRPQLPSSRVSSEGLPFLHIGLDHTGPFHTSDWPKAYVLLITCDSTRAIHIELSRSLSTADFLAAFERFRSRRGIPSTIRSDNAKTFRAASESLYNRYRITWTFITERAPWRGGYWERMNRTLKGLLKDAIRSRLISYDELLTTLCQAESIVNDRPLTFLSADYNDPSPLTASHFLIGRKANTIIDEQLEERPVPLRTALASRNSLMKHFVERWHQEYLRSLRWEHQGSTHDIQVGDVVLVEEGKAPHLWPLGRIVRLIPSADNVVRTVQVRIRGKILKRPIQLVHFLERPPVDPDATEPAVLDETIEPGSRSQPTNSVESSSEESPELPPGRFGRVRRKPARFRD